MEQACGIATATEEQSAVTSEFSSNVEMIASGTKQTESSAHHIQDSAQLISKLSADLEHATSWFRVA